MKTLMLALLLVVALLACGNTRDLDDYYVYKRCRSGDVGWQHCFENCTSTKLQMLASTDPDDFVAACDDACVAHACVEHAFTVAYGATKARPCEWTRPGSPARIACAREGWRP